MVSQELELNTRLFEATIGMADKKKQTLRKLSQVGVLQRSSYLSKVSRLSKKLDLKRTHVAEKRCHGGNLCPCFNPCT